MKVRRTSARRGAGLRSALRVVSHAPVVAFLGCVVAIAAEPASPGPAAGTPCVAAAALDSGTEVDFEVYLDGKKSGGARLVDSAMPGGGRLITLSYRSSYLWTTFEHASREVWRDGQLVCASGTGVNKGFANLEPDVDIGVTRAKSGGIYEWRVDERGFNAKDEPVLLFDAPLLAETFWLEPTVGAISVVNLGRSAVYSADVQRRRAYAALPGRGPETGRRACKRRGPAAGTLVRRARPCPRMRQGDLPDDGDDRDHQDGPAPEGAPGHATARGSGPGQILRRDIPALTDPHGAIARGPAQHEKREDRRRWTAMT